MKFKKLSVMTLGVLAVILGVVGVAVGALSPINPIANTDGAAGQVALLKTTVNLTAAQAIERSKLVSVVTRADTPTDSLAAHADLSAAHPVTVVGSSTAAWVAPTSNGGVCTYIPDSEGGFGATCATLDEVKAGDATTVTPRPDGSALVVALRVDNSPPVTVADGATGSRQLPIRSNVATGVLSAGSSMTVDGKSYAQPGPASGNCAPPAKGEQFVRCGK